MKIGLHFLMSCSEQQEPAQIYRETLEQALFADALGFESVWPVEHHFDQQVSVCSCPMLLLAAVAARAKRLRLGTGIVQLPLAHPVRVAEELTTLDMLSNGRVELGVGRGSHPAHFAGFGVPLSESRERFTQSLEIVRRALSQDRFSFTGQWFQVDDLRVSPPSLQRGRLPVRIAANSADTLQLAGSLGLPIIVAAHVNPLPRLLELLPIYHRARRQAGFGEATPDDITLLMPLFVGESRAQLERDLTPSITRQAHLVSSALQPAIECCQDPSERSRLSAMVEHMRTLDFDKLDQGSAIFATPEDCTTRLRALESYLGVGRVIGWFNFGGLVPHESVLASMRLFAERVLPALEAASWTRHEIEANLPRQLSRGSLEDGHA